VLREIQADFAAGSVEHASITRRPDAIVGAGIAMAPGPRDVADVSGGPFVKGWYVRADNAAQIVWIAGARAPTYGTWASELNFFTFTGADIDAISLAFDAAGYPVVAMERDGEVWVRYWNGSSYTLTNLGAGTSPAVVHVSPGSETWRELVLLYESGTSIYYRIGSENYAAALDTFVSVSATERFEGVILDDDNRLHIIRSVRDIGTGQYSLNRKSSGPGLCLGFTGSPDEIADGIDQLFVFTEDAVIQSTCELTLDILLIGGGGDAGGANGESTILWASLAGLGLDPLVDTPPNEHVALGGGAGGYIDQDGQVGASGGGGGANSPSGNAMWTTGGLPTPGAGQGYKGGGGRSTWGLLSPRRASSGGGGGYGGPGGSGSFYGSGLRGAGGVIDGWNWYGPFGGKGAYKVAYEPEQVETGPVPGAGGAGGVQVIDSLVIQPGQTIPITVAGGVLNGAPGTGASSTPGSIRYGSSGIVAIRVRTIAPLATPAVLTGGGTVDDGGYRYHTFTADDTVTVVTPGAAEVLVIAGGGGGGSGGGGGGGGEWRIATVNIVAASEAIVVGAGGAGGTAGANGSVGEDSSFGAHVVAEGGGGGAGDGLAAGSGATGGGGHGTEGAGGAGAALRGFPGGDGAGYNKTGGGYAKSAGGGGGAGGEGVMGAELESQGNELSNEFGVPSTYNVDIANQWGEETSASDRAIVCTAFPARYEIFCQGRFATGHNDAEIGLNGTARHPSGVDATPGGAFCRILKGANRFDLAGSYVTALGLSLAEFYPMQLFVSGSDPVQQAALETSVALYRNSNTWPASLNAGTYGARSQLGTAGAGRRMARDLMAFTTKDIIVGGVPSGGKAEVRNTADDLVCEANESGGTATVDCSRYGNGTTGASEFVPFEGWKTLVVKDSGGATVAILENDGIFPGAELDVVAGELVYRTYGSGEAIIGLLHQEDFTGTTPGPEHGDGGPGRDVPVEWTVAAPGDGGFFGGGGGGGAELVIAGQGGQGGGGAGGVASGAPGAGTTQSGGGGGGSGSTAVAGGAGGSGIVVVRTVL
jgi:hypothetical protein